MKVLLVLVGFIGLTSVAHAEEPVVETKKVTQIDFEELDVKGNLGGIPIGLISERKVAQFPPMIKLRRNFTDKIDDSTEEVK